MRWGRAYFAIQAIAGLAWWVSVFLWVAVRHVTLGDLDPVWVAVFDIPLFVVTSGLAATGLKFAAAVASTWTCVVALGLAVYATVTTLAGWGVLVMSAAAGASVLATFLVWTGRVPTELLINGPFRFRPAAPRASVALDVVLTLVQMIVFWALFLVVIPGAIAILEERWRLALIFPPFAAPAGVTLLVLASCLGVASALTMATLGDGTPLPSAMPNRLVIAGPYRLVRNPMAVAGIGQGIAIGLLFSSWLVIAYAIVGSALWNYAVRPQEEADLASRFGAAFEHYRARVRCWVPRIRR